MVVFVPSSAEAMERIIAIEISNCSNYILTKNEYNTYPHWFAFQNAPRKVFSLLLACALLP